MRHLRLLSLLMLLMAHQVLWAGPRTYRQAQAIAEKLAQQKGITITPQAKARSFSGAPSAASSGVSSGATSSVASQAYYIFPYGENRGYAIVSGDDQMPEIVAYSDRGTFEEDKMADGCRAFLDAYKQLAHEVAQGDAKALKLMAEQRALSASSSYQQPTVAPLLGDIEWDQVEPYNILSPYNEEKQSRCYAGCVATAMAQVMKYWQYPDQLLADIPAYTSYSAEVSEERYEMPQINKGVKYDWDNMLPRYSYYSDDYTQQQTDAVATLMLHCGAAVNMVYSTSGSYASIDPQILVKYFGYDPDMLSEVWRNNFSYKQWHQLIDNELQAKRPVLYAAQTSEGGHQFVCDGADGNGLYHINWGWNGYSNGYFDIAILDPNGRGIGSGSSPGGFNGYARMIIGLQPEDGKKEEPLVKIGELTLMPDDRMLTIDQADRTAASAPFALQYEAQYANYEDKPFSGQVSVGIKDANGQLKPICNAVAIKQLKAVKDNEFYSRHVHWDISYAFPKGVTQLYDIYSTDGGNTWQQCFLHPNLMLPLAVEATDVHLALVNAANNLQVSIKPEEDLTYMEDGKLTFTFSNANKHDLYGVISIYVSDKNDKPEEPARTDYIDIDAEGTTSRTIPIIPEAAGSLYVWVYDLLNEKMLVDAQQFTVKPNENVKFKMLSKSLNVKEGVYERENGYVSWSSMILPVVEDDEVVVKYTMRNNGPTYEGDIPLLVQTFTGNIEEGLDRVIHKTFTLEGNGAVTELEYRFKPTDHGGAPSFCCHFNGTPLGEVDYLSIPEMELQYVEDPSYSTYYYDDELFGYFRPVSTGISSATQTGASADGLQVQSAGKGMLYIRADKAQTVSIHNLAGQIVRSLQLNAGSNITISLPSGIYVIGKQKVMVR